MPKRGSVVAVCHELLMKVVAWQVGDEQMEEKPKGAKDALAVGLSYQEILVEVHKRIPGCQTSYNALRWYASKMREDGIYPPSIRRKK